MHNMFLGLYIECEYKPCLFDHNQPSPGEPQSRPQRTTRSDTAMTLVHMLLLWLQPLKNIDCVVSEYDYSFTVHMLTGHVN